MVWGRGFEPPNLLKDRISHRPEPRNLIVLSPADLTRLSYPHISDLTGVRFLVRQATKTTPI